MKTVITLFALLSIQVGAAESTSTSTMKAEAAAPKAAPKFAFGYSRYHYDMEGTSTANTKIYKFGEASVDVELYALTYTHSPKWTFMAIAPYLRNEVETIYFPESSTPVALTDRTEGLGDLRLMAMTPVLASSKAMTLIDIGGTAPTGKHDSRFNSNPAQGVSYNMQLGSGTPDLILGGTQLFFTTPKWVQTVRAQYTERIGRTGYGYALGDELQLSASSKYQVMPWLNGGLQYNWKNREKIQGKDKRYEVFNNLPQGDGHQFYHEDQIDYNVTAVLKAEQPVYGVKLGLEAGAPLWQDAQNADGIRLDTKYYVSGSASAAF